MTHRWRERIKSWLGGGLSILRGMKGSRAENRACMERGGRGTIELPTKPRGENDMSYTPISDELLEVNKFADDPILEKGTHT